jgi:hypothetical protein
MSDPRVMLPNPELTRFVPVHHARRIAAAWLITGVAVAIVAWGVVDLIEWARTINSVFRPYGLWFFCGLVVRTALVMGVTWYAWKWARQAGPRDQRGMAEKP